MKTRVTLKELGTVHPYFACAIIGNGKVEVMLLPNEGDHLPWLRRRNYPNGASDSQDLLLDLGHAHSFGVTHVAAFVINEDEWPCTYTVESTHVWNPFGKPTEDIEYLDLNRTVHKGCTPVVRACTTSTRHTSLKGLLYSDLSSAVADFEQTIK